MKREIEAVLFVSAKPVKIAALAKILGEDQIKVETALRQLAAEKDQANSALRVIIHDGEAQIVSDPALAEAVAAVGREEFSGELTQPQLETLSIISYRGPMTKAEIEQIRGVNCGLILRNLMIRGLVEEYDDRTRLQPVYSVSMSFLRALGVGAIVNLPDYERFHNDERISRLLLESQEKKDESVH